MYGFGRQLMTQLLWLEVVENIAIYLYSMYTSYLSIELYLYMVNTTTLPKCHNFNSVHINLFMVEMVVFKYL